MIKKLWLKLVLLYTGITGLILALCLGITFFFSCNRYEASLDAQICDQIESYQIKLLSSRQVDQSTLQELEENLDGNIYIFENGTPLFRFEPTGGLTPDVLENIFRSEHSLSTDELSQASNGWTSKKDERNTRTCRRCIQMPVSSPAHGPVQGSQRPPAKRTVSGDRQDLSSASFSDSALCAQAP